MIIDLRRNHPDAQSCEPEFETTIQKPLQNTISRRHTCSTMVRFMSTRNTLFMIPEQPLLEEQFSSSFTEGETPIKPRTRKNFMSTAQRRKSIVRSSLEAALSIVESAEKQSAEKQHHSSASSVTTCSTAELTDEDSDVSSTKDDKREAAALWGVPLLRSNRRWNDKLGEEHFLYAKAGRNRSDSAPVCPRRR